MKHECNSYHRCESEKTGTDHAAMKFRKILLRVVVVMVSVTLAGGLIWWRARVSQMNRMPWLNPENHARILAEARANGIIIAATHTDGTKYYFSGSSKYMYPIRVEELQYEYRSLWQWNQDLSADQRGKGSRWQPFKSGPNRYRSMRDGKEVVLDLALDSVAPGTTVEELLARERK